MNYIRILLKKKLPKYLNKKNGLTKVVCKVAAFIEKILPFSRVSFILNRYIRNNFGNLSLIIVKYKYSKKVPEVLLFGDSVLERVSDFDTDRRRIDEVLQALLLDQKKVLGISGPAYHLNVYYNFLLLFNKLKAWPKQVVISINLRSFSPQWHLRPRFQLSEEIQKIKDYIYSDRVTLNIKDEIFDDEPEESLRRFYETRVNYGEGLFDHIGAFEQIVAKKPISDLERDERKKNIFIYHYMYQLDKAHSKFMALEEIINYCRLGNIKLYFCFIPINYEAGLRLVGDGFIERVKENTAVIKDFLFSHELEEASLSNSASCCAKTSNRAGVVLDLSLSLSEDYFFCYGLATEHINEKGRSVVASRLCHILQMVEYASN